MKKPKDIKEIEQFIFAKLKEEYGDNVITEEPKDTVVIVAEDPEHGRSDVWIKLNYFY